MKTICFSFLALLGWASCSNEGEVSVRDAWIRLAPPGSNTAVFMKIDNTHKTPKSVVGFEGEQGFAFELHETSIENGIARMTKLEALDVPAYGTKDLKPRGIHVMLKSPPKLKEGQKVKMWLRLADGKQILVQAIVRKGSSRRK